MKLTEEQKQANKLARKKDKEELQEQLKIEKEKNQPPVKNILINIEWKKSRIWGYNPHADIRVEFKNGKFESRDGYTTPGYGYDKESTVISKVFNDFLKYKLYQDDILNKPNKPYGFTCTPEYKNYNYGVGTSCYYNISKFIGGKFKCVTSGKSFDVYEYIDNE